MELNGPGKYDELCTLARERAKAVCVALIVIGGEKGIGFSVQSLDPELLFHLPTLLRLTADQIEQQNRRDANA